MTSPLFIHHIREWFERAWLRKVTIERRKKDFYLSLIRALSSLHAIRLSSLLQLFQVKCLPMYLRSSSSISLQQLFEYFIDTNEKRRRSNVTKIFFSHFSLKWVWLVSILLVLYYDSVFHPLSPTSGLSGTNHPSLDPLVSNVKF